MTLSNIHCDYYVLKDSILQNSSTNPSNSKYYQNLTAFFNFSSIMGAPVYVSKTHMLDAE
jgi:hypothetical protein